MRPCAESADRRYAALRAESADRHRQLLKLAVQDVYVKAARAIGTDTD
jgi:hypothetical protein